MVSVTVFITLPFGKLEAAEISKAPFIAEFVVRICADGEVSESCSPSILQLNDDVGLKGLSSSSQDVKNIPIAKMTNRPDGIGYGDSWKLEFSLHDDFKKRVKKSNKDLGRT